MTYQLSILYTASFGVKHLCSVFARIIETILCVCVIFCCCNSMAKKKQTTASSLAVEMRQYDVKIPHKRTKSAPALKYIYLSLTHIHTFSQVQTYLVQQSIHFWSPLRAVLTQMHDIAIIRTLSFSTYFCCCLFSANDIRVQAIVNVLRHTIFFSTTDYIFVSLFFYFNLYDSVK